MEMNVAGDTRSVGLPVVAATSAGIERVADIGSHRVLLVNLGTTPAPEAEAVRRFLSEFLSDPMVVDYPQRFWQPVLRLILRSRAPKIAKNYQAIWTESGSPLTVGTRRIADGLAARGAGQFEVRCAYRYGTPSLQSELEAAARDAVACLEIIPLFPQWTTSTMGTIEALIDELATELDLASAVKLTAIEPDDSGYISALVEGWRREIALAGPPEHLVVSFHGIPRRVDRREGGVYRRDCRRTYQALLAGIEWPEEKSTMSYQSRFGPEPWLKPATATVLKELPRAGIRRVAVATPGFLTEGLETVEEIGMRGKATFLRAGGEQLMRLACVESNPSFIDSLARAVGGRSMRCAEDL
jgi:ferrochelatase